MSSARSKTAAMGERCEQGVEPQASPRRPTSRGRWAVAKPYLPLMVVVLVALVVACAHNLNDAASTSPLATATLVDIVVRRATTFVREFMGTFLVIFSMLKLFDLRGFAGAFARYDLIAGRWPGYGYLYPFLELLLGACLLSDRLILPSSLLMLMLMIIGTLGVVAALRRPEPLPCACLGTTLDVPLSLVVVSQNVVMALGAIWILSVRM